MHNFFKRSVAAILGTITAFSLSAGICLFHAEKINAAETSNNTALIHILALNGDSNAILLESIDEDGNKVFGMVDSGEDKECPPGGNAPYPGYGFDEQVISYLKSAGVTSDNMEFYIGTHPHSDHIGTADLVIREFSPDRVYLLPYSDEYIFDKSALWDNQYVYDKAVKAAAETPDVNLIQHLGTQYSLKDDNSCGNPDFKLGNFDIQIVNYSEDFVTSPKIDANLFSLGVIVSANSHRAFISGDMNNCEKTDSTPGDLDRVLRTYNLYNIDLMTYNHHGLDLKDEEAGKVINFSLDYDFINGTRPDYLIQTGNFSNIDQLYDSDGKLCSTDIFNRISYLKSLGIKLYSAPVYSGLEKPAIIADFSDSDKVSLNVEDPEIAGEYQIYIDRNNRECVFHDGLPYNGFFEADGKKKYGDRDGSIIKNRWLNLNNKWYYFDNDGVLKTGLFSVNGNTFYSDSDGIMQTGWKTIDGKKYYFDENGYRLSGWKYDSGHWYFLNPDVISGLHEIDRSVYLFDKNGIMLTGMQNAGGKRYYFNKVSGAAETGWKRIDGLLYYFDNDGSAHTGWYKYGQSTWYYMDENTGAAITGWRIVDGKRHYFNEDSTMKTGWLPLNNTWYFFESDGAMATGWKKINGDWYYLNSDGTLKTGWLFDNNSWYFLNQYTGAMYHSGWHKDPNTGLMYYFYDNGRAARNETKWLDGYKVIFGNDSGVKESTWIKTENNWYYVESGKCVTGKWKEINGSWYYFNSDGTMKFNEAFRYKGSLYFVDESGKMYADKWVELNNSWYYADSTGAAMESKWLSDGDKWYYLGNTCQMITGWASIDGCEYFFDSDGTWIP